MHTIEEYRNLLSHMSDGPWKVELTKKKQISGDNWLIAEFGLDVETNENICVTTDGVNSSRLADDPRADAEFLVCMRNEIRQILEQLEKKTNAVQKAIAGIEEVQEIWRERDDQYISREEHIIENLREELKKTL